ncbi:MAG: DUF5711 family protein [Oscillospiraceae bacterium]|nr:DUF5711 family protein [Oscillospiraceae bacterium]
MEERRTPEAKLDRKKIGMTLLLLLLVFVTIALLINRDRITWNHFFRAIYYRNLGSASHAEEFHFSHLASNNFAIFGNGLAVASGSGLAVYDRTGGLIYAANLPLARPIIETGGNFVLAYDHGGFDLQVGNAREALWNLTASGRIIDARINENGWVTLSIEQAGTLGVVYVHDAGGQQRLRVSAHDGHLIAAALAADNRTLATLTVTESGGRIAWFDITGGGARHEYIEADEIFFDFWFTSRNGAVGAISNNMVRFLSNQGEPTGEFEFPDQHLRAYDTSDGNVALYLSPLPTGAGGHLVVVESGGRATETAIIGNLFDLSLSGRYLSALFFDQLVIYRGSRVYAAWSETEGMHHTLMREDGTVFRLSSHRARLLVP